MSDDLIQKAIQSHMLDRAQLEPHADEQPEALSPNLVLQLAGFDKPKLTVVLVDDGPGPETTMWGDLGIGAAETRNQHSCIVRLAGPFAESMPKAIGYVRVTLPAFAKSTPD
jgi:hypothetical protein